MVVIAHTQKKMETILELCLLPSFELQIFTASFYIYTKTKTGFTAYRKPCFCFLGFFLFPRCVQVPPFRMVRRHKKKYIRSTTTTTTKPCHVIFLVSNQEACRLHSQRFWDKIVCLMSRSMFWNTRFSCIIIYHECVTASQSDSWRWADCVVPLAWPLRLCCTFHARLPHGQVWRRPFTPPPY